MTQRLIRQAKDTLDEAYTHSGIEMFLRHTASGDTYTTTELFLFLITKLRRKLNRPLLLKDLPLSKI